MKLVPLVALFACLATGQTPAIDWKAQEPEILRHYSALVQIDSSNPPGNETLVVDYLKKVFDAEGIPSQIFALDPQRANIVARLKGNGKKRPILIMAHTDVVGVQREKWPVDPFGAIRKDGYIWGRGTVDDKDKLAANLMLMLLLKRSAAKLDRDVIFLAESGEEGTTGPGIEFMVNQHFDQIDAEYCLTEGGDATIVNGRITAVSVTTTEKLPRWVRLVVNGTSGHGSIPRTDNALVHLSTAVGKLGTWETPLRLNDTTRTYFERLAGISDPAAAARYNGLSNPARTAAIQRYLFENEPKHYSMLRTSVVPTILKAGFRVNVIPSEAEATIDVRMAPGEDEKAFLEMMRLQIGDPAVKIERVPGADRPATPPSRLDNDMFRALETVSKRMYPGSVTLPTMLTGATDMAFLRAKGMQSYGIGAAASAGDQTNYGPHSDVERMLESSLYSFVRFTWEAVLEVSASK
ncbi:MAG TPA: M20/M25/M40 family metallo-hydrolase [Bryobacteraceae bacterium]|jgi:acetylornithine deacetylase/succinyl-diaminopimelate desuccinylase-like protein